VHLVFRMIPSLVLSFGLTLTNVYPASGQMAVVVSLSSDVQDITLAELTDLYLGGTSDLGGHTVRLTEFSPKRYQFYTVALGRLPAQIDRNWIGREFRGDGGSPPKGFVDVGELLKSIAADPGAIGFVPFNEVDESVRVLSVEGFMPNQPEYQIQEGGAS
jgi:hypothetical protein